MPTRTRHFSPSALVLAGTGVTQDDLAIAAGRSSITISRQLSGHLRLKPEILAAIRLLAGSEAANEIATIHGIEQVKP